MDTEGDEEMHSDQEYAPSDASEAHQSAGSDEEDAAPQSPMSNGPASPSSPASPQGSSSPRTPHSPASGGGGHSPSSPMSQDGSRPGSPQEPGSPDSPDPNTPSSPVSQGREAPASPGSPEGPTSPSSPASHDGAASGDEDEPSSPVSKIMDKVSSPHSPNEDAPGSNSASDDENDAPNSEGEEVVREDAQSDRGSDNEDDKHSGNESDEEANDRSSSHGAGGNSPQSDKDNDRASVHSEIEERASISSDKEDEQASSVKETDKSDVRSPSTEQKSAPGSDHDSDSDSVIGIRKPKGRTKSKGMKSDSENDSDDDEEDEEDKARVGELIADIFGESDDDEEFEGFAEDEVASGPKKADSHKSKTRALSDSEDEDKDSERKNEERVEEKEEQSRPEDAANEDEDEEVVVKKKKQKESKSSDHSDDDDDDVDRDNLLVSDFDLMMQKKKEESGQRRKRKGYDIINDSDDLIVDILNQMKFCADEDRVLNKNRQAATKKLKLLPLVVSQLKKLDLKVAFLDQGVLNVMTEWLAPLPDRSLPHLQIRDNLLRLLAEFPPIDQSALKSSGIGRAVMYLYKHPRETKDNREKAGKLISEWSRPIFNLNTNYHSISKEEREKRDFDHMPKKRKLRLESGDDNPKDIDRAFTGDEKSLRPGDKGWVGRARVPLPSTKDYVVRPKWNIESDMSKGAGRKQLSRLDRHVRSFNEKKKAGKMQRAVSISIEGRKMAL